MSRSPVREYNETHICEESINVSQLLRRRQRATYEKYGAETHGKNIRCIRTYSRFRTNQKMCGTAVAKPAIRHDPSAGNVG